MAHHLPAVVLLCHQHVRHVINIGRDGFPAPLCRGGPVAERLVPEHQIFFARHGRGGDSNVVRATAGRVDSHHDAVDGLRALRLPVPCALNLSQLP